MRKSKNLNVLNNNLIFDVHRTVENNQQLRSRIEHDYSYQGVTGLGDLVTQMNEGFNQRRILLTTHLHYMYRMDELD